MVSTVTLSGMKTQLSPFAIITLQLYFTSVNYANFEVRLYGPDGSYIVIVDKRGYTYRNIFAGTLFTDTASNSVATYNFNSNNLVTPLQPEQPFSNLRGTNPNGQWNIVFFNDFNDGGQISLVRLTIQGNPKKERKKKKKKKSGKVN